MDYPWWLIAIPVMVAIVLFTIIMLVQQKNLKNAKERFGLVEGNKYEVLQNGGRTHHDLTFVRAYYGNNSSNGRINFEFVKKSPYRDGFIDKTVVIKMGSIWKITKL